MRGGRIRGGALASTLLGCAALVVLPLQPADAYNTEGCQWPGPKPTVKDISAYGTATQLAIGSWNGTSTPIYFQAVSSNADITIDSSNDGNTNYDGITYYVCSGGHFSNVVTSVYNTYYTGGYGQTGRKQVMVHELGHALGLAHAGTSACSGQPIMYKSSDRWFVCSHQNPQSDDVNGINHLY